ncbi:hypothetical protein PRZ48_012281 [Zasmidium cellare]|uniref:Uncharacterized protein n=1 Tax=Zasmidium cellare TaxID=395010 RepID=A0ABR0E504_ZASCE|nr:hypothetical protein PRZ48_012281 [Zasmidium cellare]
MGYRQQFFVTAKINGKYRMLAIVHHQWIYGRTSLRQCLNILKIFSSPANLPGIRRELAQAASTVKPSCSQDTYSFISTALIIGSSYHEEGHYTANVKPQQLNTAWNTFPNDDGIVVFDITSPSKPRYGYIWLGAPMPHAQYASRLPLKTAMTAAKYINGYYNVAELAKKNVNGILTELRGFDLIDAALLNELWPNGNFKDMKNSGPAADLSGLSLEDFGSAVVDRYLKGEAEELPTSDELKSYRECITNKFAAEPSLLKDGRGLELFLRFAGTASEVDLTPFKDIEIDKILAIVKAASAPKTQKSLTIWLPSIDGITLEQLKSIVGKDALSALHLARTLKVKLKEKLLNLFDSTNLIELTSSLIFSRAVQMVFNPSENLRQAHLRVTENFPNGIGTKFPIRQIVYLTSVTEPNAERLDGGGLCWKQRTTNSHHVALPVKDAQLSTHEMVKLAPAALARLATCQEWTFESQPVAKIVLGIAKMLSVDETHRIKPLPGLMYSQASNAHYDSSVRFMGMLPPKLGGWTLLALHERPATRQGTSTIRYAFISEDSPGNYNVLPVKTFLSLFAHGKELETLDASWQAALARLKESMMTAKKAPETEASTMPELAAVKGGALGRDVMSPEICGDVVFGVAEHEEVVEALAAVEGMREKPINRYLARMGVASCISPQSHSSSKPLSSPVPTFTTHHILEPIYKAAAKPKNAASKLAGITRPEDAAEDEVSLVEDCVAEGEPDPLADEAVLLAAASLSEAEAEAVELPLEPDAVAVLDALEEAEE